MDNMEALQLRIVTAYTYESKYLYQVIVTIVIPYIALTDPVKD